jgi:hypothetical protein
MIAISIWVLACTLVHVNTCYCSRGGSNGSGSGFNLNGGGFNNNIFLGCDSSANCHYFANGGFSDTGSCIACYQCCCLNYPGIGPCAAAAAPQAPAGGSTSMLSLCYCSLQ